jgi:hypothetical protein
MFSKIRLQDTVKTPFTGFAADARLKRVVKSVLTIQAQPQLLNLLQ